MAFLDYRVLNISKEYRKANALLLLFFAGLLLTPFFVSIPGKIQASMPVKLVPPVCSVLEYTGKLCPGCGLTRSVVALYNGDYLLSNNYHPKGYIIVILLFVELGLRFVPAFSNAEWVPWLDLSQFFLVGVWLKYFVIV